MPLRRYGVDGVDYVANNNVWGEWSGVLVLIQLDHIAQLLELADHFLAFGS